MKGGALRFTRAQKAKSPDETHRGYDADQEPPIHLGSEYTGLGAAAVKKPRQGRISRYQHESGSEKAKPKRVSLEKVG